jgi:hypothetical protein
VLGSGESLLEERVGEAWYEESVEVIPVDQFEALRSSSPRRFVLERPFEHVDLVKLDVEGFEPQVLAGMQRHMASTRPTMIIEFRGDASLRAIKERLPKGARILFIDDETIALRREPADFSTVDHQNLLVVLRDDLDLEALCMMAGVYLDVSPNRSHS